MAALGSIVSKGVRHPLPSTLIVITDYDVVRGKFLGAVTVVSARHANPNVTLVSDYVVRQIRVLFRQLWPAHGQRFPQ